MFCATYIFFSFLSKKKEIATQHSTDFFFMKLKSSHLDQHHNSSTDDAPSLVKLSLRASATAGTSFARLLPYPPSFPYIKETQLKRGRLWPLRLIGMI